MWRGGEGAGVFYLRLDQSSYIALSLLPFQPPQQFFEESRQQGCLYSVPRAGFHSSSKNGVCLKSFNITVLKTGKICFAMSFPLLKIT